MNDLLDEQPISRENTIRFRLWVILIWAFIFAIGHLFKIMHWPGNSVFRVIGAAGFIAYSLSFLILIPQKNNLIIVLNSISLLWIIILIWGVLFNDGYPFNAQGITAQAIAFAILFLIHFGILFVMKKARSKNN